jgi:hypothetical protein
VHRRRLLVGFAAVAAAACGLREEQGPSSAPTATPTDEDPPPDTEPTEAPEPEEPDPEAEDPDPEPEEPDPDAPPEPHPPYEPSPNETHPNAKALGAAVAQALLTYDVDESVQDVVARATDGVGDDRDVDLAREVVHADSWSRAEVLYPQFGGLTATTSSIMVVVRQVIGSPGGERRTETRTVDVRLRLADGTWIFDLLDDVGGPPVERPDDLPDEAVAVLDDDRIELPDSARWDIYEGETAVTLLALMTRLADRTGGFAVCTLSRGHPTNVFGTDRLSDHTRGRAVDIHRVGEALVIDDRASGSPTLDAVDWLYEDEIQPVVGAPLALDGFGGRSFTDDVHQDHLHVAVPRVEDRDEIPDEELAP